MRVVCKSSNVASDVRCAVCGQGFLVNWTQSSPAERARQCAAVLDVLRKHHAAMSAECAHPVCEFCLPEAEAPAREAYCMFSGAAPIAA